MSPEVLLVEQTEKQMPELEAEDQQQSGQSPPSTELIPESPDILLIEEIEKHQPELQPYEQLPPSADNAMVSSNDLTERDKRVDQLEFQLRTQTQELERLRSELQQARHQGRNLQTRNRNLVDELHQQRKDFESQSQKLNEEVGRLQKTSFHVLDDARWMPMDASALAVEFSKLRKAVNKIAKSYAIEDFSALDGIPEERQQHLMDLLSSTVNFESQGVEGLKELASIRHAPRLCLGNMISHVVHRTFLDRPFYLMEQENGSQLIADGSTSLSVLYETFAGYDEKKSHLWRSDTLRLLNPIHLSGTESGSEHLDKLARSIENIAKSIAETLTRHEIPDLLQVMDDTRSQKFIDELTQLFVHAGQLSLRLWCQRPIYRCQYLPGLAQEAFLTSSEILQPHPLHQHSDPLDTALDGKLPKIVVHPAVLSFGTHEGEHYDQSQILEKAVVWLDV